MPRLSSPLAAIPCKISRSGFPDERIFSFNEADGKEHVGSAPVHYFWASEGRPLNVDTPSGDDQIDGKVAAFVLKINVDLQQVLVEVPDGTVAWVDQRTVGARPTEVDINVSIRSRSVPCH